MNARAIPLARFAPPGPARPGLSRIGCVCALLFTLVGCVHYGRQGDVPPALIEAQRRLARAEKRKAGPEGQAAGCLAVANAAATAMAKGRPVTNPPSDRAVAIYHRAADLAADLPALLRQPQSAVAFLRQRRRVRYQRLAEPGAHDAGAAPVANLPCLHQGADDPACPQAEPTWAQRLLPDDLQALKAAALRTRDGLRDLSARHGRAAGRWSGGHYGPTGMPRATLPLVTRKRFCWVFVPGATLLTTPNDHAAITYLASLVPGFSDALKYAVAAGAVTGGGLHAAPMGTGMNLPGS